MKGRDRRPPRPNKLLPLGEQPQHGRTTPSPSQASASASPHPTQATFRIATPMTDTASHLGDLMFSAGVLPQPTASTPAMLVHPNALISTWTRNENMSKLGHYMLDDESQASPRAQHAALQRVNTYLTETKQPPPHGKRGLPPIAKHTQKGAPNKLPPIATTADVLHALQVLQDSMKAFQSQVAHHANDAASASSPRGGGDESNHSVGDADPDSMSKMDLWKHKHSLLPPGVHTPTFANPEMVRYVPSKYIQKRIYDIRFDPDRWFELKERVAELQEEADRQDKYEAIQRNRRLAGSVSPLRKSEIRDENKFALAHRQLEAKQRRDAADAERLNVTTQAERQRIRHHEQAIQLIVFTMLGARVGRMINSFASVRNRRIHSERNRAAVSIQRAVRKHLLGAVELTGVQAFLVRARLVRRFITKMKVKVIIPKYADVVRHFLKSIRFENRILFAFRKIHDRVVTAQRLVRRWQADKLFMTMIRSMQWDKCVSKRVRDFSVMATKGSSLERDLATRELEDLTSITAEHKLSVLAKYRSEGRQMFLEAMRFHSEARKEAQRAEDARTAALLRKRIPKKPVIRCLIAAEQIERMVRNAARQTRLERTMNANNPSTVA